MTSGRGNMPGNIKGTVMRYISIFILSCLMTAESYAFDKDRPLLAATLNYPPYQYIENGEPKGIAVEIITEAIRRTGVKQVIFNFYPWKRAVHLTQSGQSDILFNAGKNDARQQWGEYIESTLILQRYVLFKKSDSSIKVNAKFDNVNNSLIAIRLGYLYGSGPFRQALDSDKFGGITLSNSTQQSVDLLLGGRVDLMVGDYLPVMRYIKKQALHDKIDIVKDPNKNVDNMVVLTWPTFIVFSKKTSKASMLMKLMPPWRA